MRPVATKATWYPEATDGLTEFFGVKEVEQLDATDALKTGDIQALKTEAKTAAKARGILFKTILHR